MKGMDRVKRGKGFRGLLNYLFKNSESRKIGGNMLAEDPRNLSREFAVTRRARPEVEKPVWHNALRLPKVEKISDEKWLEIIDEYMQLMGFDEDHMRTYVMHDEADGQHVHIIASRISPSSRLYTGENENLKSTQIIGELERKYGLIQTPQRKEGYNSARKDRSLPSRREAAAAAKDGDVSNRSYLQTALSDVMQNKPDVVDFIIELRERGITAKPNIAKTGRMNGFSFEYNNVAFKASSLGRAYGWSRLQEHIHFDLEAHVEPLRAYADDLNIDVLKREKDNERIRAEITDSESRITVLRANTVKQQQNVERVKQRNNELRAAINKQDERIEEATERAEQTRFSILAVNKRIRDVRERLVAIDDNLNKLYEQTRAALSDLISKGIRNASYFDLNAAQLDLTSFVHAVLEADNIKVRDNAALVKLFVNSNEETIQDELNIACQQYTGELLKTFEKWLEPYPDPLNTNWVKENLHEAISEVAINFNYELDVESIELFIENNKEYLLNLIDAEQLRQQRPTY